MPTENKFAVCHAGFALDGHAARNELLTIANAATGYELGLRNV